MTKQWYVLHVLTGSELEVRRRLVEIGLAAIVIQETVLIRRGGAWHQQLRIFFPGYVFVFMDGKPSTYHALKKVPGVIQLLPKGDPHPLTPKESARIVCGSTEDDILPLSKVDFSGSAPRIIDGPLKEWEDFIVSIDRHRRRAQLRIPVLGEGKDAVLFIDPV